MDTNCQYVWRHRACFPAVSRNFGVLFAVGTKAFMVGGTPLGTTAISEVWQYDATTDSWIQKNNFPTTVTRASAFVINDTAYVGLGMDNSGNILPAFYRYEQATDQWTPIASFQGSARYDAMSFVLQGNGYIISGNSNGSSSGLMQDVWSYNPASGSWTQMASFPGAGREWAMSVAAGGMGYVGSGIGSNDVIYTDNYQYNPAANIWSAIADFPGTPRCIMGNFAINDTIYMAGGNAKNGVVGAVDDCWRYDSISNSWVPAPGFSCIALAEGSFGSFIINGHGYDFGAFYHESELNYLLEFGPLDTAFTEQVNVLGNDTDYCGSFNRQLSVSDSCAVWSTGEEASQINISSPGTYWVRINDSCGVSSDTIVITQTNLLVGDSITNATCGLNNGSAGIYIINGASPFAFNWSNGDTTAEVSGLSAGDYVVTVTDLTNCSSAIGVAVNANVLPPGAVSTSESGDTLSCYTGLAFQWFANGNKLSGDTNAVFIAPGPGDYYAVITDSNGCSEQSDIIQILGAGISNITADDNIHIYPNPLSNSNVILEVNQTLLGSHAQIFDSKGSMVNEFNIESLKTNMALELESGVYIVHIKSGINGYYSRVVKL
jgi:N-acetylneuraminic acid mutarotase